MDHEAPEEGVGKGSQTSQTEQEQSQISNGNEEAQGRQAFSDRVLVLEWILFERIARMKNRSIWVVGHNKDRLSVDEKVCSLSIPLCQDGTSQSTGHCCPFAKDLMTVLQN